MAESSLFAMWHSKEEESQGPSSLNITCKIMDLTGRKAETHQQAQAYVASLCQTQDLNLVWWLEVSKSLDWVQQSQSLF